MNTKKKIEEIKSHRDYKSRTTKGILTAIEIGIPLDEEAKLFEFVLKAYKTGKHRQPAKIRNQFKKEIRFLKKEFEGFEIKPKSYL